MPIYNINWIEKHYARVEARDREEAWDIAIKRGCTLTLDEYDKKIIEVWEGGEDA